MQCLNDWKNIYKTDWNMKWKIFWGKQIWFLINVLQVCTGGKRKKDEINVNCLDFNKKILHTAWHPTENIIAVAATNNLFLFQDKF